MLILNIHSVSPTVIMANPDQVNILRRANRVNAWNNYRLARPNQGIDLSGADLQCLDLSNCNLRGANLQGANLFASTFGDTVFENANLQGASLRYALNLRGANFTNSILQNANLSYCDVSNVFGLNSTVNCQNTTFYRSQLNFEILANPNFIPRDISFHSSTLGNNLSNHLFDNVNFENCFLGLTAQIQ